MTDEVAMQFVAEGDLDKAAVLYERYKRPIFNFYLRFGVERESGQDMTQQVFYRLIHYRHTFKEGFEFRVWIYRIARNIYHDHLKERTRKGEMLKINHLQDDFDISDEQSFDDEQHDLLKIALQKLPSDYREVLHLSRYEELKYEQIAEILNVSVSVVKVRVHRAIKQLREIYFTLV